MTLKLPEAIAHFIGDAQLVPDTVGESPCRVYSFLRGNERFFLKFSAALYAPTTYSVLREARVLDWLDGRLKVPELVLVESGGEGEFMITRSVPGVPLSSCIAAGQPALPLFREALHQMQSVAVDECPFDAGVSMRLAELDYLMAQGLCAAEYDLAQWPGLAGPEALRTHLQRTRPIEDLVFSHGDLGDSNIFIDGRDELYFIDLGRGGLADRWLDIAFIQRDLREVLCEADAAEFLQGLGLPDNPSRRIFFEQLDELF
ncbi:APH(3') family aminoglycoside O-phosphotransferase [Pseudomonas protegens]|uniref:APH(3') family aminoglycoside O-phosphotransferase n=1 Tax=Pseudomonas protegens TaxID=380021 RepID=UPI001A91F696|nr:APH(3') family aminoglycoside O-phosphotransferase [Pseudomonas protegens]